MNWKNHNALDFGSKVFRHVSFWKTFRIQKITFWFNLLRENDIFYIFCAFLKSMVLNWKFNYVSDFELKKYNASDFKTKFLQRVRFWFKNFTTRQKLDLKFYNVLDLKLKILQRVKF